VVVTASGQQTTVARIVTADGDLPEAEAGQAITLTFADEVDASRGDVLTQPDARPEFSDQFAAHLVWMNETPLFPGRPYLLKAGTRTVTATVSEIKHRVDINTLSHLAAKELQLNEIGFCNLSLSARSPSIPTRQPRDRRLHPHRPPDQRHARCRHDRGSDPGGEVPSLAAARRPMPVGTFAHPSAAPSSRANAVNASGQQPFTLWLTGLPRSGKTSIAAALEEALFQQGKLALVLDGERMRGGLSADLGFSSADRWEHQRRAAEVARIQNELGVIAIVALVSPVHADRDQARRIIGDERFLLVHCDAPVEVCEARDENDLYARARRGEIEGLTGVDAPYEIPQQPWLRLDTVHTSVADNVTKLLAALSDRGLLRG
jgi:bifunctional enzyme CysN/CysC